MSMAIVDFAGVPTAPEFQILADYFRRFDITCTICTPDDMEWKGGVLYAAGEPVDFVYKRILTTELLQKYGMDHPMIHALRAGAICALHNRRYRRPRGYQSVTTTTRPPESR